MSWEDEDIELETPIERIEMGRREFTLVAALMAFLLAFFPWLRTEEGVAVAREAAERLIFKKGTFKITMGIKGFELPEGLMEQMERDIRARGEAADQCARYESRTKRLNRHDCRRAEREARLERGRREVTVMKRVTHIHVDGLDLISPTRLARRA